MYLSQLILNPLQADVRRDLASSYELHRTLMRAFVAKDGGSPGRVLFRVEPSGKASHPVVLVQSAMMPIWSRLPGEYAYVQPVKAIRLTSSSVADLPEESSTFTLTIRKDDVLQFRMTANPTVKRNGKRCALTKRCSGK